MPPSRAAALFAGAVVAGAATPPTFIWSSYGADPTTELTLTWGSASACAPAAEFGLTAAALAPAPASALTAEPPFLFDNADGVQFISRARLTALPEGARIFYRVGCAGAPPAWSPVASASLLAPGAQPTVLLLGDMGRDGGEQSLPALEQEAAAAARGDAGAATFAAIAGDFAYDMHDEAGARGARFLTRVSNFTASLPTMTTIGNHEQASGNASHYTNLLGAGMPGPALGHWYAFEAGLIKFLMLSSEVYHMAPFTTATGLAVSAPAQLAWLNAELAAVNRSRTPWLVAVFHRPFYCSNADGDECTSLPLNWPTNPLRVDLEPVFMRAGVDLCVEAHEHSVEIIYPLVNGVPTQRDFVAPRAPVHWVTGTAGCNEDSGLCQNPIVLPSNFTAEYLWGPEQFGYTRMTARNATVLHIEQIKVRPAVGVWAAIDIVQPNHGAFA